MVTPAPEPDVDAADQPDEYEDKVAIAALEAFLQRRAGKQPRPRRESW